MPIPGRHQGACPESFEWPEGHVQPGPGPRDMTNPCRRRRNRSNRAPHGTCPPLASKSGHNANMPIPGRHQGACPESFEWPGGHVQPGPGPRDMTNPCRRRRNRSNRAPHGTCPPLASKSGHNANMPIPGRHQGACPAGIQRRGGTCPSLPQHTGHVPRREARKPTPPGPRGLPAIRVRGLRVRPRGP